MVRQECWSERTACQCCLLSVRSVQSSRWPAELRHGTAAVEARNSVGRPDSQHRPWSPAAPPHRPPGLANTLPGLSSPGRPMQTGDRMTSPSRPALATINPVEFDCKNGCRAAPLPIALFNCSLLTSGAPREFFSVGSCQLLPPPRHPLQPAVLPGRASQH